jgi:phage terminase small subunit
MSDAEQQATESGLTAKEQLFVGFYLQHGNGAKAARQAGTPAKTARNVAYELLTKPHIKAAVKAGIHDIIPAAEIIIRMAEVARSDMSDFWTIGEEKVEITKTETIEEVEEVVGKRGKPMDKVTVIKRTIVTEEAMRPVTMLDLRKAKKLGVLHLIKKYSVGPKGESIELYDAEAARKQLGMLHGLWIEKKELSGPGGAPIEINEIVVSKTHEKPMED